MVRQPETHYLHYWYVLYVHWLLKKWCKIKRLIYIMIIRLLQLEAQAEGGKSALIPSQVYPHIWGTK